MPERSPHTEVDNSAKERHVVSLPKEPLIGAAYYPEYQAADRVKDDFDLMAAAAMSVIRVGESVWSTWEPRDGEFELEWLEPVLDGARQRDISVILGTPTYTGAPWLARRYPEIAAQRSSGQPVPGPSWTATLAIRRSSTCCRPTHGPAAT